MFNSILAGLLVAIQIFDIWSTVKILKSGGVELNTIMTKMMKSLGVLTSLVISKAITIILVVLSVLIFGEKPELSIALVLVNLYYIIFVVIGNSQWLIKSK